MENKLKEPIEEAKIILMDFAYGKYNTESLNVEKQCDWKAALIHDSYKKWFKEQLEAQAEISFKEGAKLSLEKQGLAYLEGKQSGIKEVVEYIKKYRSESTSEFICLTFLKETWNAKLKEWEVKDENY